MPVGYTGYQGFRPSEARFPPSLKPGETLDSRSTKYCTEGHGVTYRTDVPIERSRMRPYSSEAFGSVDLRDYKIPNRRGVMAARERDDPVARSKPFIHQSVFNTSFNDFKQQVAALQPISAAMYRDAFNKMAVTDKSNSTLAGRGDENTDPTLVMTTLTSAVPAQEPVPYVSYRDIHVLLRNVHGERIPQWVIGKVVKYFEASKDGHITWQNFEAAIGKLQADLKYEVADPARVQLVWISRSKMVHPKIVGGAQGMLSTHTADMGSFGSRPADRQLLYKRGMLSSSPELMYGTSKDTNHVPGYGGFVPASKTNAQAVEHGDGRVARSIDNNMRMNFSHNVPGYTGHAPRAATTTCGETLCGCSALTSSGSAALGLIL